MQSRETGLGKTQTLEDTRTFTKNEELTDTMQLEKLKRRYPLKSTALSFLPVKTPQLVDLLIYVDIHFITFPLSVMIRTAPFTCPNQLPGSIRERSGEIKMGTGAAVKNVRKTVAYGITCLKWLRPMRFPNLKRPRKIRAFLLNIGHIFH